MKRTLIDRNRIPYGGYWRYHQAETNTWLSAVTWDNLLSTIREHRRANDIPIGIGFSDEVENQVCQNHPDECEYYDPNIPRNRHLTMDDVIRGTKVLLAFKLAGSPLVERQEAERRGAICAGCRFNVTFPRPCVGLCPELKSVVQAIVGNQGTEYDKDLKSCSICGCMSSAHIWLPLDLLDKGLTPEMRSQFNSLPWCWKKTQTT